MKLGLTEAAWEHPPTVIGYGRLVRRRAGWLFGLTTMLLAAVFCMAFGGLPLATGGFFLFLFCFVPWFPWVLIAFHRRRRVKAVLQSYPWQELTCHHPPYISGQPATVAVPFEGFTGTFRIVPFPVLLTQVDNDHPDRIWFAGDPRFGGVVSPVGGHYPVRVVTHVPRREACGGEGFALALRVGLVRSSGKGTRT